jgi:plastocyanin
MRFRTLTAAVALAGALAAPTAAQAADTTIGFTFPRYTPANVTIAAGDTVTWQADRFHDFWAIPGPTHHPLKFDGNAQPGQFSGTRTSRTFTTPGNYRYYCAFHWSLGMQGTVTVTG